MKMHIKGCSPFCPVAATVVLFLLVAVPNRAFAGQKAIAVMPFKNLHEKKHLEFVKNIVHEKLFTQLASTRSVIAGSNATKQSQKKDDSPHNYIIIGVSSLEDAEKLYKVSKGKVPDVVLQGEYFMIRDRLALNVSLLNPEDGERIEGTGELVKFKGHRYSNLPRTANFQKSLSEDIKEPLEKLLVGIWDLIEGRKKDASKRGGQ